jgi:hypothetical protein
VATNPRVPQGTLNRIRGSVLIPSFPTLNVTAPYLHKQGLSLALQGQSTTMIQTMTGVVTSPEPYMMAQLTISLLRTQNLADLYKARMELDARIGDLTITPDAATFSNYNLINCAISSVREMTFAGEDPGFIVLIDGSYDVNSELWNMV